MLPLVWVIMPAYNAEEYNRFCQYSGRKEMTRLFENVKMDTQAERKKLEEARREVKKDGGRDT